MTLSSINRFDRYPASTPLVADGVLELHAARLLMLLRYSGNGTIDGLTKLAKLDFFVRYPLFFNRVRSDQRQPVTAPIEPSMIRFRYGPWDKRYYQVLAYLEAKALIAVSRPSPKAYRFALTPTGLVAADELGGDDANKALVDAMQSVRRDLGRLTGSRLKQLVYDTFRSEVADKKLGDRILT